jgi:hypothetical protein
MAPSRRDIKGLGKAALIDVSLLLVLFALVLLEFGWLIWPAWGHLWAALNSLTVLNIIIVGFIARARNGHRRN